MQKNYLILFLLFTFFSCKKASAPPPPEINSFFKPAITADDRKTITTEEAKTYHVNDTYNTNTEPGIPGNTNTIMM